MRGWSSMGMLGPASGKGRSSDIPVVVASVQRRSRFVPCVSDYLPEPLEDAGRRVELVVIVSSCCPIHGVGGRVGETKRREEVAESNVPGASSLAVSSRGRHVGRDRSREKIRQAERRARGWSKVGQLGRAAAVVVEARAIIASTP